ncbi:hypothetical protein NP493_282g03008 [Ridgeia piscesae]|uniref:Trichohyalin-like n=1 Tax=Ridgeia piscesae TaxID=27915 RepID=A0AAD9NX69_RIDPI|nr:hypothetical protein NP493_282g03008 [Ridgeia piscesae]
MLHGGKDSGSEYGMEGETEEMARESAQVRRELERIFDTDRVKATWRQMATPKKAKLVMPTTSAEAVVRRQGQQVEALDNLQRQLVGLTLSVQTARKDKQMIEGTIKKLQEVMRESRADIKNTERQLKENRTGAEDARTELMLTEFKRDSARKELESLVEQLQSKKRELETLEEHPEPQDGQSGATLQLQQELTRVMEEREKIRTSLSQRETEVKELMKQVTSLKDTLATQQRKSRSKIDALAEDVEREQTRQEEAQGERTAALEKLNKLEKKYRHLEKEKNQLVKEQLEERDELKSELQAELAETRASLNQQLAKLRSQLTEATTKLTTVQAETDRKDELVLQLREHVLELEHAAARDSERQEASVEEMKRTTADLTAEKEQALGRLREAACVEKAQALEALEASLSQQQTQQLRQLETQLKQQMTEQQGRLTAREVEVEVLKDRLKEQDAAIQDKVKAACKDTQATMQGVLAEERQRWEAERAEEVKRLRLELEQSMTRAHEETGRERDLVEKHLLQISQLKKELEETRGHARQAYREKMTAVNVAKESAELEKERELDLMREGIEKETHRSIEHLRETIKHQEAEIQQLRSERYCLKSREEETVATSDRHEKKVINDINEECRSIVELLGQLPRKVTFSSYNGWSPSRPVGYLRSSIRPTTSLTAAMSSLRSLGEELRQRMVTMSEQMEDQKHSLGKLDNDKKEELDALKKKMQTEKLEALEMLKDRLIKEHLSEVDKLHRMLGKGKTVSKTLRDRDNELQEIQRNMTTWKASTVEKLAKKFQEEMARELEKRGKDTNKNRAEWEHEREVMKREIERLKHELLRLSMAYNSGPNEESPETAQLLRQLQGKVKILQMENTNLKRAGKLSISVPDLSVKCQNMPERSVRQYELRAEEAEGRAKMAEDRAEQNAHILNQKMLEISKLQSTLTQQTKELMQLERAYAQLQQRACRLTSHTAVYVR